MFIPATIDSLPSLLAQAAAATTSTAAPSGGQAPFSSLLPTFLFMGVIFYFLLIRPQQKRAKEQAALIASVRSGDEVVTTGGLHGIVSNARDPESKTVLVKFAENVKIEVDKSALTTVIKPGSVSADAAKSLPAAKVV